MTDTKMKTLGELAKELRGHYSAYVGDLADEAADRLGRIEQAFADAHHAMMLDVPAVTRTTVYAALKSAIEGEP